MPLFMLTLTPTSLGRRRRDGATMEALANLDSIKLVIRAPDDEKAQQYGTLIARDLGLT